MTGSAGQKRVPAEFFEQWLAYVPPLHEQDLFVNVMAHVDFEITLLDRQLAAYRKLKRGLMQRLLTDAIVIAERGEAVASRTLAKINSP